MFGAPISDYGKDAIHMIKFGRINSNAPRCVDGRKAVAIVEWDGLKWVVAKRDIAAANEHGPQFLGAGLMFVKALQEKAGYTLEQAFDAVEEAFGVSDMVPQIHIDDHHGEYDFANMPDEEVIRVLLEDYIFGCGFAAYAWVDESEAVLRMALARHWRIQILTGEHTESGAYRNTKLTTTFMTTAAVNAGQTSFNLDEAEAQLIFIMIAHLQTNLNKEFSDEAMEWVIETYADVVVVLNGVKTPEDIVVI